MVISPLFLYFSMAFMMILGVIITLYVVRLASVDQQLEKAVLLLTVLANKQGATEDDIRRALSPEEAATSPVKAAKAGKR